MFVLSDRYNEMSSISGPLRGQRSQSCNGKTLRAEGQVAHSKVIPFSVIDLKYPLL